MFDKWDEHETGGRQRKRLRDHFGNGCERERKTDIARFQPFVSGGYRSSTRNSFVREELHRPITPPSSRIATQPITEEQQATVIFTAEPNDLPSNLAHSIFQRENRPIQPDLLPYPPGNSTAGQRGRFK